MIKKKKEHKLKSFTIEEHFSELKSCLVKVLLFFIIATLITLPFSNDIFAILSKPLIKLTSNYEGFHFIYTKLTEGFTTELKISLVFGLFFTSPVFFFQLYKFLAPGLYMQERKIFILYLLFPPILFLIGVLLVYFIVMPVTWKFFLSFQNLEPKMGIPIKLEAKVSEYINLIIELFVGFGVAFQLPIAFMMLAKLHLVTPSKLVKFRRYAIVVIFIVAAMLTPPDIFSQIILALPLILLYEISIFCCKRVKQR